MVASASGVHARFRAKLCRCNIHNRIKIYGFIECVSILSFINHVCDGEGLDLYALRYIHGKVSECLRNHASNSDRYGQNEQIYYFQDLRALQVELEFVISLCHN